MRSRQFDAGSLRSRVTVEKRTRTSDGRGGQSDAWSFARYSWASIRPASARLTTSMGVLGESVPQDVIMRAQELSADRYRLQWGERELEIVSILDPLPDQRGYVRLTCREQTP